MGRRRKSEEKSMRKIWERPTNPDHGISLLRRQLLGKFADTKSSRLGKKGAARSERTMASRRRQDRVWKEKDAAE